MEREGLDPEVLFLNGTKLLESKSKELVELWNSAVQFYKFGVEQKGETLKGWFFGKSAKLLFTFKTNAKLEEDEVKQIDLILDTLTSYSKKWQSSLSERVAQVFLFPSYLLKEELKPLNIEDYINNQGTFKWDMFSQKLLLDESGMMPEDVATLEKMTIRAQQKRMELKKEGKVLNKKNVKEHQGEKESEEECETEEELNNLELEEKQFFICTRHLQRICLLVHSWLSTVSYEQFIQLYSSKFHVFTVPQLIPKMFELHRSGKSFLSLSIILTFFERTLSDAFYNYTEGKVELPSKLSELLAHPVLSEMLGNDFVFLLRTIIGPLRGLNLRNVIWHGFVSPKEFQPSYTSFVLVLILSMEEKLSPWLKTHRPLLNLAELTAELEFSTPLNILHEIDEKATKEIHSLFERSFFILPTTEELWKDAFDWFARGEYYYCLSLLFPQLEHCLRRIFVCQNKCADRMVTAESDVLYTTLDIILAENFGDTTNKIFTELGDAASNALFDLLVWKEGPRVRDLVSHGLLDPESVSVGICERILCIALGIALRFDLSSTDGNASVVLSRCDNFLNSYRPCFHPKIYLEKQLLVVYDQWKEFYALVQKSSVETEKKEENALEMYTENLLSKLQQVVSKKHGDSLFSIHNNFNGAFMLPCEMPCTTREVAKLTVLRNTTELCKNTLQTITKAYENLEKMVKDRTAWKRNRKAFALLCKNMKLFWLMVGLFLTIIEERAWSKDHDTSLPLQCFNVAGSVSACALNGQWIKLLATFTSFAAEKVTPSNGVLSNKESAVFWADLPKYINSIAENK